MSVPGILNYISQSVAYGDSAQTASPVRQFFNWTRKILGLQVRNPAGYPFSVDSSAVLSVFNGSRSLGVDGTTVFALSKNTVIPSTYRLASTSGTAPGFRTDRGIVPTSVSLTFTDNLDGSATLAAGSAIFGAVQAGDMLFVPGVSTGDSSGPFSPANEGLWTVLTSTTTSLILSREPGQLFSVAPETKTGTAGCLVAFSGSGTQIGDKLTLSAGFAPGSLRTYTITNVTPSWVEFTSTTAVPAQSGILPGATGVAVYTALKRFLRVETDQECVLRLNGDTGNSVRISPILPGDEEQIGWFEKFGPVWSLTVVNLSPLPLSGKVFSAE